MLYNVLSRDGVRSARLTEHHFALPSADKADMDVESFSEGILGAIVIKEGEMAGVGSPIAYIAETEADLDAAKAKAGGGEFFLPEQSILLFHPSPPHCTFLTLPCLPFIFDRSCSCCRGPSPSPSRRGTTRSRGSCSSCPCCPCPCRRSATTCPCDPCTGTHSALTSASC
jgi:hypothetical protein